MEMHNPPHPGEIVCEDCLEPLGLTIAAVAEWLGVSHQLLFEPINGHNGLTGGMTIRLEKGDLSNAETWLGVQLAYDLWQAKQRSGIITVKPYPTPATREPA